MINNNASTNSGKKKSNSMIQKQKNNNGNNNNVVMNNNNNNHGSVISNNNNNMPIPQSHQQPHINKQTQSLLQKANNYYNTNQHPNNPNIHPLNNPFNPSFAPTFSSPYPSPQSEPLSPNINIQQNMQQMNQQNIQSVNQQNNMQQISGQPQFAMPYNSTQPIAFPVVPFWTACPLPFNPVYYPQMVVPAFTQQFQFGPELLKPAPRQTKSEMNNNPTLEYERQLQDLKIQLQKTQKESEYLHQKLETAKREFNNNNNSEEQYEILTNSPPNGSEHLIQNSGNFHHLNESNINLNLNQSMNQQQSAQNQNVVMSNNPSLDWIDNILIGDSLDKSLDIDLDDLMQMDGV
eukprot:TRINITY_DN107_c0_g2_i1.p1 TRINITY_DN107_c0_g2~~TRINITY_DN107_c0_g2_i1.p1  ORF type:complete len:348 (+),score=113.45 TRINITY_DN107_c0_g2_i1:560-1603(+)